MLISRPLVALFLCGAAAAHAEEVTPLISRPMTLRRGGADVTLHMTYANWSANGVTADGESLAAGIDFGANDKVEIGLATAFPINPGAGFGSVLGSMAVSASQNAALRVDFGYERFATNGGAGSNIEVDRFFGGIGAGIRVPITPTVAFVSGRVGAVQFGNFGNIGRNGVGVYYGASYLSEGAADFLVVSGGSSGSGTNIGINLPAGLLLQPDPHVALTLQSGYSTIISTDGSTASLHYIPLALEVLVTPASLLDVGARFFLDGNIAQTNVGGWFGYGDQRELLFWLRLHI